MTVSAHVPGTSTRTRSKPFSSWYGIGPDRLRSRRARQLAVVLLVVASFSFSIVYTSIQTYDQEVISAGGYPDTTHYIALYRGEQAHTHHVYRVLTPWLASLMPGVPKSLFSDRKFTTDYMAAWRFGLVNFVFLTFTGVALYLFQLGLGFTFVQSLGGAVLFFASMVVTRTGGLPMTDPGLWFFLVLGFVAIQRRSIGLLFATSVTGVLNNELFLMLTPMVPLVPGTWTVRLRLLFGILPGFLVFLVLRMVIESPHNDILTYDFLASPEFWEVYAFRNVGSIHTYVAVTLTFGPLWLPAAYACWRSVPFFL